MRNRTFLLIIVGLLLSCVPAFAQDFTMKPGLTLSGVRDEIRAWRKADSANAEKQAIVNIEPGEYFLAETVEFTPEDSNTIYQAASPKQAPVFTRGKKIDGWKVNKKGWFVTKINAVKDGKFWFDALFVNGKRAIPARTPNTDVSDGRRYFYILEADDAAPASSFIPRDAQKSLFEQIGKLSNITNVKIKFYHVWQSSLHRVKGYDAKKNLVTLTGPARWDLDFWGPNLRYHVEGIESALDVPGEFLLKRDGTLTYIPRNGETLKNTTFFAPDGPKIKDECGFLRFAGTKEKKVKNIVFKNIRFVYDVFTLPYAGISDRQSSVNSPTSILANYAQKIEFINCDVKNIGGYAFWFHQGCSECRVEKCLMEDMGTGGVRIGPGDGVNLSEPHLTRRISVKNCIIRGYGRLDAGGVGIWIGHSPENEVLHNDISDGFYTGVSCGWVLSYRPSVASRNKIEFNHIHHIGQGVLSDMGGVYTLGISPGTTVSNNVIHDVYSYNRYGRGGYGLYADEGSSNIVMENNLVYRVHTGTFHQHYGKENIIRNNILAFSIEEQIKRTRSEEHLSFTIERNIIIYEDTDKAILYSGSWQNPYSALNHNIYWNFGDVNKIKFDKLSFADWQKLGKDKDSIIADPHFVNAKNNDFRFTEASKPALEKIGFKPFDFTRAGVEKDDPAWVKKAADYVYVPVIPTPDPPPAPPMFLEDDFDSPRKGLIKKVKNPLGSPNAYKIVSENGNKFLRIICNNSYEFGLAPRFFYYPAHIQRGVSLVAFDVRVSDKGQLVAEFRDKNIPYRIGPALRMYTDKILFTGGSCSIPKNTWIHVEILCPVAQIHKKTYTLKVKPKGAEEQSFEVRLLNDSWNLFEVFVFAAFGANEATIDLDNIKISKEK